MLKFPAISLLRRLCRRPIPPLPTRNCSTITTATPQELSENPTTTPLSAAELLRHWGFTDEQRSTILSRHPSISRMKVPALDSRLRALRSLGFGGSDLLRTVTTRPILLACHLSLKDLPLRISFLRSLFGPDHLRAVLRNPSILNCSVPSMSRCVSLYSSLGVPPRDLGRILVGRPTVLTRTDLSDPAKLDIIRRTGVPPSHKMYKYVVSIVAVSRLDTLQEKISNLEKFLLSSDDVMRLFGRIPNILTLSAEKLQRNMTFVVGTMKLQPGIVLKYPVLLRANLDNVIKPRFLLMRRIEEMELEVGVKKISLVTAIGMTEDRFLRAFVLSQEVGIAEELIEYYRSLREVRRLAEGARAKCPKGFPF